MISRGLRTLGAYFTNPLAAFFAGPILARALGPSDRGYLASIMTITILATIVGAAGKPDAYSFVSAQGSTQRSYFLRRHGAGVLIWAVIGAAVLGSASLLAPTQLRLPLALLALFLGPLIVVEIARGGAVGDGQLGRVQGEVTTANVGRLVVILALYKLASLTVLSAALAGWVTAALGGVWYVRVRKRVHNAHLKDQPIKNVEFSVKTERWLARRYLIINLATQVRLRADQIILLPLAGAFQVGIYAVAVSLSQLLSLTVFALRQLLFRSATRDREGSMVAALCAYAFVSMIVVVLVAQFVGPWLILRLFGQGFSQSIPALHILLINTVPLALAAILGAGVAATGNQSTLVAIEWGSVIVGMTSLVLLGSQFGAVGAAWASLLSSSCSWVANFYAHQRATKQPVRRYFIPTNITLGARRVEGERARA